MELYFSPLACSLATRIALHEAGVPASFIEVDSRTKLTRAGEPFAEVNPLGLVPTLRTDDGEVLTENAAILQYVADRYPAARLAPPAGLPRVRLQQWLSFIGTELHKTVFVPLLDARAPDVVKTYALAKGTARLDFVQQHLQRRGFLLEDFSVADAYLLAVLNWTVATPIKLSDWPGLAAYVQRLRERPSAARAIAEEYPLYTEELARRRASA